MERNVNYTLIGGIFFAVIVCMVIFILWIGRIGVNESKYRTYEVYTDKEVSGIGVDTPVKYKGITIGSVKKIGFDKNNFGMVKIELGINAAIPIRKGSTITPDSQGLAGLSYLSLQQNDTNDFYTDSEPRVLQFKQNFMGRIVSSADEVTKELLGVLKNIGTLVSPKNVENISNIITSLDSLTLELAQTKENLALLSKNSNLLVSNLNKKLETGEYDLKQILNPLLGELEMSLINMDRFFDKSTILLNKIEANPYDTLFGERK
ncbi:MlaD family protein [Helicobacter sp. 11S02596-1]|uniref:MlaD family protein n=1 Tax=Helicobacter sp. 11S02596-1 TaxID=1476194 RepID=UPI000BA57F0A|nr:MlaD family protein [Helicobacter sp. 11S02596-1]PAF42132.1 hypothetical protein BJI48_07435 [Helicobacter sp. 11S02596-1]